MADIERYQLQDSGPKLYEDGAVALIFRPLAELTFERAPLHEGDRVLDAACGTGIVTRVAVQRFPNIRSIVGVDLNAAMLDVARASMPTHRAAVEWRQADICALPFPDGSFDVVTCQQGLQFFPDRSAALREMKRVLAHGGRLVFTVALSSPYHAALADSLARHVNAQAARSCLAPYALDDHEVVRKLVSDAEFDGIDMRVLELTLRANPAAADLLFETVATRSPFTREIAAVAATIKEEVHSALHAYRAGNDLVMPWKTHLVQARAT